MATEVKVNVGRSEGGKESQRAAQIAGPSNLSAEQQAQRARAAITGKTISSRWTEGAKGLFDPMRAVDTSFTTEDFRRRAYEIYASNAPSGMNSAPPVIGLEQPQTLEEVLGVDPERTPYLDALAHALGDLAKDLAHFQKLAVALDDLLVGGDVKFNTVPVMAGYAQLSQYGKRWLPKAGKTLAYKEYVETGSCAEHGAMEATGMRANQRWLPTQKDIAEEGKKKRLGACRPILDMLVSGAMGAAVKADEASTAAAGDLNAAQTPDPSQVRADKLLADIKKLIASKHEDKHGEKHLGKTEIKKLIADIADEPDAVKDRLYQHPELMQQLTLLDPEQTSKLVASMNTVDGLYNTLLEIVPMLKQPPGPVGMHGDGQRDITGRPTYAVPREVFDKLSEYLIARPGDAMAPARMRVLQHEQLMGHFVDPMPKDEKEQIFRLVSNGTLTPTLVDNVRDAAKNSDHANAARALMRLASEQPAKLEALKDDHIFRKEIERVDKTVLVDGFDVNPYHLCLQTWGIPPLDTSDPGVGERHRAVDPSGAPARPLGIEDRLKLEDELLDPTARRLRSEIAENIVDDDDMMSICRRYEKEQVKYEAMWRQLRKAPGPALVEHYNRMYNHDLRGEVNEYVSDEELLECNRILGFTKESSTTGIVGGKANVHDAAPPAKGPGKILDLDQRLREVKDDDGQPLTQTTNRLAHNIAREWLYEVPGRDQYAHIGIGVPQFYFPGISKDGLLEKWQNYRAQIDKRREEIVQNTPWHPTQVHAIEFLENAVRYVGGSDLATKIQRFYNRDEAAALLGAMKLTPKDIQDRAADAKKEEMAKDPSKGVEAMAQQQFAEPAQNLFAAISKLPPGLEPEAIKPIADAYKRLRDEPIRGAPVIANDVDMRSVEERPPRTFRGFYRLEYGIDPDMHVARTLRSLRDHNNKDVTAAAQLFGVEDQLAAPVIQAPDEELKIDERNRHLVTHGFTEDLAKQLAADTWKAIHDGTRFNVVITKLYTDFSKEEQRLIRIAFRQLSGGIDLAFYIQQSLQKDRTTTIGGEGTEDAKKVTPKTELDIGEDDPTKLQTYLTAAQHGTVDAHALLKAAVANRDIDQMFRVCDEAEPADRAKILEDRKLLADIQAACDTVARDRIYKTLTNQADLVDRLYQRADGWGTDEKGMREDIKYYVKKLRKQFGKEIRDREHQKKQAGEQPMDQAAISEEVDRRIRDACLRLSANPSVKRILDEELSAEELSEMESLVMHEGKTTAQSDVLRAGNEADGIINGITNTPAQDRVKLRSDPAYLMLLKERLTDPDDYRKAIDALMSDRSGEDKLAAVDTHATKKEPRELLRDIVELDINELRRLQADPELQAKLLASFDDPEQRRVARELLKAQLPTPPVGADENAAQQIEEENRLRFLTANALARLRIPLRDKLGWPTMLDQCVEVYKMELEPRLQVDKTSYLKEHGTKAGTNDQGKKLMVAHYNQEDAESRVNRQAKGRGARAEIWEAVDEDVRAWARVAAADKPKDRTLSRVYEASEMVKVVEQAVLKLADPSAERVREHLGATVTLDPYGAPYGGGESIEIEQKDDDKGLQQALKNASNEMWIDEWSNVIKPAKDGGPSLAAVYAQYKAAAESHNQRPPDDENQDLKAKGDDAHELHKKKQAFIDFTIDISSVFEQLVLPHVGSKDERTLTADGGTSRLRERDNKKYNELVDIGRGRLQSIYKGDTKYLIADRIGCADPDDFKLLDTPNRDEITAFAFRDSKFLRSRGEQAGSGWAADKQAQVVDQRMMQYGHLLAESRTNVGEDDARGQITATEQEKLQESGEELERALTAFKEAKAKVAFWMSMIVKVLVTVILTALTGPLAGGPLAALFFTTAIAGCSAGAAALVNEAVLAEDYDLKDEGVEMIGKEMLTAFITAGTTMLAQKMLSGVAGLTQLGRQAKAAEHVMKSPPPMWRGFLHEASEEVLSETMSGVIDAGLIAIDPVHWMHGVNEGRDRAFPLAWEELGKVKSRALMAGLTSAATSGFTKLTTRKSKFKKIIQDAGGKPINVRQAFKQVLGNNHERVIATLTEYFMEKGLHVDLDSLPGDLLEGFLNEVGEASIEMHTGGWHEKSRSKRAKDDVEKNKHRMTAAEQHDFEAMNSQATSTDPYVSIDDYLHVRDRQAVDAVYQWQEQHPDQKLTEAEVKAFIWSARNAATPDDFRSKLERGPKGVDQQDQQSYEKHVQDLEQRQQAKDKKAGATVKDPATTATPKPPAVAVVQEVASVEEGYALMRRLAGGDQTALGGAKEGFTHEGATDAVEWGLGRTKDGTIVLLRGEAGAVDFDQIPGITALAHSHPATLNNESRALNVATQNPTGVPITQLLDDANAGDLYKFLPSTGDLAYLAEASVGSHVVFTPYVHVGDSKVGNPSPGASPEQRIEIVINNPRLVGRSLIQRHQGAYSANIIIRTGDGTVLWSGPMYAVTLSGDGFKADQPSLKPQYIEMGMMPEPKQATDEDGDSLEAGGLDKYKVPKQDKKQKAQAGEHRHRGKQEQQHQHQQPRARNAADVFAGETPQPGEAWTFRSGSGHFYPGRYQGVDENGLIVIQTQQGIGRLDPTRLENARRGYSHPHLHAFGPHDRITLYTASGTSWTGVIVGYDEQGYVWFQTDTGMQRLDIEVLDVKRTERVPAAQRQQHGHEEQQGHPQQHHQRDQHGQDQQQQRQQQAARTAADVFAGQTPLQNEVWTFRSGSGNLYLGRFLGIDENGHIVLYTHEGQVQLRPGRLVNARRGVSHPALHDLGPTDRVTLYSARGNPRTGVILGYDESGNVHFQTDQGELQILLPHELDLRRIDRTPAQPKQADKQAPNVTDHADPKAAQVAHFGEDAQAHLALAQQLGVMPSEVISVGGATFRVGKLFDIGDGRVGALFEVEVGNKRYMRVAYRSNSQGGFRVLPARNHDLDIAPGYDKGVGEHAIMLPNEVEELLARQLAANQVRRDIPLDQAERVFEGAVPHNRSNMDWFNFYGSPDHIKNFVKEENVLNKVDDQQMLRTARGKVPAPGQIAITEEPHRPNFHTLVRSYPTSTSLAGNVTALVYRSFDNTLEYVMYRDDRGRVWFKSVSKVDTEITPQGVRAVAVKADALCMPLWEYKKQLPHDYQGVTHPEKSEYTDAWKYLSQLPEIRAWYEATGQAMPGPETAMQAPNLDAQQQQTTQPEGQQQPGHDVERRGGGQWGIDRNDLEQLLDDPNPPAEFQKLVEEARRLHPTDREQQKAHVYFAMRTAGTRREFLTRRASDVAVVAKVLSDSGVLDATVETVRQVFDYLFDSAGIGFSYLNCKAWQRIATGKPTVADLAWFVHETTEIGIMAGMGVNYMGRGLEIYSPAHALWVQNEFDPAYSYAHAHALRAEYQFLADRLASVTGEAHRLSPEEVAAIDLRRDEGRKRMVMPDGTLVKDAPQFPAWQLRAKQRVKLAPDVAAKLGAPESVQLAHLLKLMTSGEPVVQMPGKPPTDERSGPTGSRDTRTPPTTATTDTTASATNTEDAMDELNSTGSYEHRVANVRQIREDILTGSRTAISPDVSDEAIARMKEHVDQLTDEELAAIQGYSSQDYEVLNRVLRDPSADPAKAAAMRGYVDAVRRGLDKLPAYEGEVYRGTALSQRNWQRVEHAFGSGELLTDLAFSSSSESKEVAEEFLDRGRVDGKVPVFFTIQSRTGKQIEFLSKTANEVEVLFNAGVSFKVIHIEDGVGPDGKPRKEVHMREAAANQQASSSGRSDASTVRSPVGAGKDKRSETESVQVEEDPTISPVLSSGLGEPVGQGGFGTVYRVPNHPELVVKMVTGDDGGTINAQLQREADTLKRLTDAGVPTVFERLIKWVAADGTDRYGILMKYIDGAFSKNVLQQGKEENKEVKPEHRALVNDRTVRDLRKLRESLVAGRIDLQDLQFMIGSDGSIHVIDPARAEFLGRGDAARKRLKDMTARVDRMIAAVQAIALENAGKP